MPIPKKSYRGNPLGSLTQSPGLRVDVDQYGLVTGTANFMIDGQSLAATDSLQTAMSHAYRPGSTVFRNYYVNKVSMNRETGDRLNWTIEFMGVDRSIAQEGGNRTQPNVEGNSLTQAAPIETHKDFKLVLAGDPTTPKNGAMFDTKTGLFKGFTQRVAGTSVDSWLATFPLAGVRQFLTPGFSIKGSFYTIERGDLGIAKDVGRWSYDGTFRGVKLIPDDIAGASRKANTDYLLTNVSIERFAAGKVFKVNFEILRSEDPGWHPKIYTQSGK